MSNTDNKKIEKTDTVNYYKCVKCQKHHDINDLEYCSHLKYQNKEGILTKETIDISNRTKGIWAVKKSKSKPAFNVVGTALRGKYKIARCPYTILGSLEYFDKEEAEANAAFICLAVNNYEKVLEALKFLVQYIEHYSSVNILPSSTAIEQAKAAIEKAEQQTKQ